MQTQQSRIQQPLKRPAYLALDAHGREYERSARVIGELPLEARSVALVEATATVARLAGLDASKTIPFGAPAYKAYAGMNRPIAKIHSMSRQLLMHGDDLSLDLCPSYN